MCRHVVKWYNKVIIGVLMMFCSGCLLYGQIDKSFWFAAPFFNPSHGVNDDYNLVIFTIDSAADVTISMPANPSFTPIVRHISRGGYVKIPFATNKSAGDAFLTVPYDSITKRGLLITSTTNVQCYYHVSGENSEAFTLKGKNALGTHFVAAGQKQYWNPNGRYTIHIVATEDNTEVVIIPSNDVRSWSGSNLGSDTIRVLLHRGETYGLSSYNDNSHDNLAGSIITSTRPIAVTVSDDSAQPQGKGCQDDIGEQLIPSNLAGKEYVVVTNGAQYDVCTIFALNDNTQVTTLATGTFTLNKGEYREISLYSSSVLYITSTEPVVVFETMVASNISCELGGTILPPIRCGGSKTAIYQPYASATTKVLFLVTHKDNIGYFTLNGITFESTHFQPVPGSVEYYYTCYQAPYNYEWYNDGCKVECSSGVFQMGVAEGDGAGSCTVGFFSDYSFDQIDEYSSIFAEDTFRWEGHFKPGTTEPLMYTKGGLYFDTVYDANGCRTISVLHLKGKYTPDNVESVSCSAEVNISDWTLRSKYESEVALSSLVSPLVGDIDDDNMPEVVCFGAETDGSEGLTKVYVLGGDSGKVIREIQLDEGVDGYASGIYGMVKLPNRHTMLVVSTKNHHLRGYDLSADISTYTWQTDLPRDEEENLDMSSNISFADFNKDSFPEIYIGNTIYDAEMGILLLQGSGNSGKVYSQVKIFYGDRSPYTYAPFAADIDGDDNVELVAGNEIYKISITNRYGTEGNTMTLYKSISPPKWINGDGHTQVADFNLDGHLDVLISTKPSLPNSKICIYVWDVFNNTISDSILINNMGGKGLPLITDINADGLLDIVVQSDKLTSQFEGFIEAYTYSIENNAYVPLWHLDTWSYSYGKYSSATSMLSSFDFNHDGINEIIVRTFDKISVYNGSGKSHITGLDTTVVPYVICEYLIGGAAYMPFVVVDVDDDGSAEIMVIGGSETWSETGTLKALAPLNQSWAPARSVWNQFMYNVLNINKDLTIPAPQLDNAMTFIDHNDNSVIRRPLNNFFQQATSIDRYGRSVNPVADVEIEVVEQVQKAESLEVTLSYCNKGQRKLNTPYYITTYANNYRGDVLKVRTMDKILWADSCEQVLLKVPLTTISQSDTIYKLVLSVNDIGEGIAQHGHQYSECDTLNNTYTLKVKSDTTVLPIEVCETELPFTHIESGVVFPKGTVSGTDSFVVFTNRYGCDSVLHFSISVYPTTYGDTTVTLCMKDSFLWNNRIYKDSGDYQYVYQSFVTGCDSIVTLHLRFNPLLYKDTVAALCQGDSFLWQDSIYYQAGDYQRVFQSVVTGCDSIETLHLVFYPIGYSDTMVTLCPGEIYFWRDSVYDHEGDYRQVLQSVVTGCDSVVTLHVEFQPLDFVVSTQAQCADDSLIAFDILSNCEMSYLMQFVFSVKAVEQQFKDTTIVYEGNPILIPNHAHAGTYDVEISPLLHDQVLNTRHHQFTLLYPSAVLDQHWDDFIGVLTNKYNGGYDFVSFQWYKDGMPIEGENGSYLHQPLDMGASYSALLTETDGTQLMTCGIIATEQEEISLYPTFAHPQQRIQLRSTEDFVVWVYSSIGQLISFHSFTGGEHFIDSPSSCGVYIVKMQQMNNTNKTEVQKLIIR